MNGNDVEIPVTGAYELISHERHTEGVLQLNVSDGLQVLATCFTPGLVA